MPRSIIGLRSSRIQLHQLQEQEHNVWSDVFGLVTSASHYAALIDDILADIIIFYISLRES